MWKSGALVPRQRPGRKRASALTRARLLALARILLIIRTQYPKLDRSLSAEDRRLKAEQAAIIYMVERSSQAPVIVILERHEAEWLQHTVARLPHRRENFGHASHRARLRLECDLDEIAFSERMWNLQQPARRGYGLKSSFSVPAIF